MIILIITLLLVVLFAWKAQQQSGFSLEDGPPEHSFNRWHWAIVVLLLLVFGFRTGYNDTTTYMKGYETLDVQAAWGDLGAFIDNAKYSGFSLFCLLLKTYISPDPQVFVFVFTLIFVLGFLWIYRKTAVYFDWTLFIFIASGLFMFGLAGIKQITAMTLWYMGYVFLNEGKRVRAIFFFVLSPFFHVYAITLFLLLFLQRKVWSIQTFIFIGIAILLASSLDRVVSFSSAVTDLFGIEYDMEDAITGRQGMNILRVLLYAVVPVMSFLLRNKVNTSQNRYIITGCNAAVITFAILIIASVAGANAVGRIAYYFIPLSWVSLPWLIKNIGQPRIQSLVSTAAGVLFFVFFYFQYHNYSYYAYHSLPFRWLFGGNG